MIAPARMAAETHLRETAPKRLASAALMPLAEAVARLTAHLAPVAVRTVAAAEAVGRIAGADLTCETARPPERRALRDGWAARAEDVFGASPYAPILPPKPLAWVEAGAVLPEGHDVVLPPEALEGRSVVADAPAGAGTRATGEEIAAGTCLVPAGTRITSLHRLALDAAGLAAIPVRSPRLQIVVTGAPDVESLSPLIGAFAAARGAEAMETIRAEAGPEAIAAAIRASRADATLVIGGTGFGRGDHSAAGLATAGSLHAHGVAIRPGETAGFGAVEGRPVLLLPGRPDAALGVCLALLHPLIAALAGADTPAPSRARLLRKVSSTIGLSEIVFARRETDGILPLGGADLPLGRLIAADCALSLAAEAEGHPAGTSVEVWPL